MKSKHPAEREDSTTNRKSVSTMLPNEPTDKKSPETAQKLLDLHIAEYQALTNRCTYWISLQFTLVSLLLVYLGLVASVWSSLNPAYLVWGSALVIQIVAIVWLQLLSEQYRAIRYMETKLRSLVEELVGEKSFWCYEKHLNESRGTGPVWWEYSLTVPVLLIIGVLAWLRFTFLSVEYPGLLLNIGAFIFVFWQNKNAVDIRRAFFKNKD